MARLAAALTYSDARARAAVLAREAVAIARRLGHQPTLHLALSCYLCATWGPDNLEERLEISRETTRLAAEIGGSGVAEMHAAIMTFLLESGDAAAAAREAESYCRRTELTGRRISRWILATRQAATALLEGRFAEVEALASAALEIGSGSQNAAQYFGAQMLVLRREQGRLDEMVGAVEEFVAAYPAVPAWRATLAWIYVDLGRDADAQRELDRLAAADLVDVPRDMFWLLAMWLLADVAAELGDAPRAHRLYEALRPFAGRCVTGGAAFCGGSVERSLGVLARTIGPRCRSRRRAI
jgi:tetratricopeptide (TPR) repeat protein